MPSALTTEQRQRIQDRLYERAKARFIRFGLAKTTVADLARDAGIGKGTFYHFCQTKEELFLQISAREELRFKQELVQELGLLEDGREALAALLHAPATLLDRHPFLRLLLEPETMSALLLRVAPEQLQRENEADRRFFARLVEDWQRVGWLRKDLRASEVVDVLSGLFLITLHRNMIGEDTANRSLQAIIESLCDAWLLPAQ